MQLESKAALITGGGSGIGQAAARLLASEGAAVAVVDLRADRAESVAGDINAAGGRAIGIACDVTNADQVAAAVERTVADFGRLDILLANAGINGVRAPIDDLSADEWDQVLDVNLRGAFLACKHAVPHLKRAAASAEGRDGSSIIFTGSINGTRSFSMRGSAAYMASKGGLSALAKYLAAELGRSNVRVNVVCPGSVRTNLGENTWRRNLDAIDMPERKFPAGAMPLPHGPADAEQVARLVLFLAGRAGNHITGAELHIDGGESLMA